MRVPPVPIPNTEVKPHRAESTWRATAWEDRSSPGFFLCPHFFYIVRALFGFGGAKAEGGTCNVGDRMFFRGGSLSVLSMRACIRLNSIFLLFQAFGLLK